MYSPDDMQGAAARAIATDRLSERTEKQFRADLQRCDWTNGRCDGGLLPVYDILREGAWPATAADRDELCRRWQCSTRQLYQWRRDVLMCWLYATVTDMVTNR